MNNKKDNRYNVISLYKTIMYIRLFVQLINQTKRITNFNNFRVTNNNYVIPT